MFRSKWLCYMGWAVVVVLVAVILLYLAVWVAGNHDGVMSMIQSMDAKQDTMRPLRWSLLLLLILCWVPMIRQLAQYFHWNLKQVFFLKTLHPYIALFLLVSECLHYWGHSS